MANEKCILIIATMDTKGAETLRLRDKIADLGKITAIMDLSMAQKIEDEVEITADEVAKAGGGNLDKIRESRDRKSNTDIMTRGAINLVHMLLNEGKIHGIIAIGGSTGSLIATDIMRALPFGFPKLMISSTAALPGMATRYIGTSDIMLMHSVIEIFGTNSMLDNILDRGARAICGMVEATSIKKNKGISKLIAMTMMGPCEKCASQVYRGLINKGFQIIGFNASGIGDRAMDEMIAQGLFNGVIDLAPVGVLEYLIGGMRDAGPNRLESAGRLGIPQVISTAGVNMITISKREYTEEHKNRRKYDLDKLRTWLRASPEELIMAAQAFAQKLNKVKGKVVIVIPKRGWSSADYPGTEAFDPEQDMIFINTLKNLLIPDIEIRLVDASLEDPLFANSLIAACEKIL